MSNPLFNLIGNQLPTTGPYANMANMIQQFNQFKNTFHGDPKQQIQQMLNSGRISQAQYNQAVQMANAFQQMLNK